MNIVCVDDQSNFLELLEFKVKKKFNVNPQTFENGDDCIDWLKTNHCDLLLCDYKMQNGNGVDVLNFLMKNKKDDLPYFVLMTTESTPQLFMETSKYPRQRYISKHNLTDEVWAELFNEVSETDDLYKKERSMKDLGEMFNIMMHEINNPLTIIKLRVDLLKDQLSKKEDENITDSQFQSIESSTQLLLDIIKDVKTFVSAESFKPRPLHLSTVYPLIKEFCATQSTYINVTQLNSEHAVLFNQNRLIQVIVNLINNAIDAISDSADPWVRVGVEEAEDFIFINVVDSGMGIPEDQQSKLWEKHFSRKKVATGTGFGLFICKKIMRDFNGDVFLDTSKENTTFTLKLPKSK